MASRLQLLRAHQARLLTCRRCPDMVGPPVVGAPVLSPVVQIGQAPGAREAGFARPFAWTAGKTLFAWYGRIGVDESTVRARVYMAAVCRCFPGRLPRGRDRVPSDDEVARCADWLCAEFDLLRPVIGVDRSYLETAIGLMKEQYQSIDGYMTKGLGLDDRTLEALRDRLTES